MALSTPTTGSLRGARRSAGGACTHRGLLGERARSSGLVLAARCRNYIYSTNFETTLNQIVVILETRLADETGAALSQVRLLKPKNEVHTRLITRDHVPRPADQGNLQRTLCLTRINPPVEKNWTKRLDNKRVQRRA